MVLFGVVCKKLRCRVFWMHVILLMYVGIIVVSKLLTRSCNVDTISKPSTKMLMSSPRHVIDAKEMVAFRESKISL